jgi:hypothetical protein
LASEGAELAGLDAGTLMADAIYMLAESICGGYLGIARTP